MASSVIINRRPAKQKEVEKIKDGNKYVESIKSIVLQPAISRHHSAISRIFSQFLMSRQKLVSYSQLGKESDDLHHDTHVTNRSSSTNVPIHDGSKANKKKTTPKIPLQQ